jgi:two-component system sensor histidine kinase BaeS
VGDLLSGVDAALEPMFRERGLHLVVDAPPPDLAVEVDAGQVSRALRNVVTNAAQHSPAEGEVRVSVERVPEGAVVRVADAGQGIAADDLPHIFERFYRADRARQAASPRAGSGIGLTIARELVRANGGEVWVERTGPDGTVFAIGLPGPR